MTTNDPWESLALGPDQTYAFAPDAAAELFDLLATVTEQSAKPASRFQRRASLLRQVALMDRLCEAGGDSLGRHRLLLAAGRLTAFDQRHGTGRGRIPPGDRAWELDPVGYVRQEYVVQLRDADGGDPVLSPEFIGPVAMTLTEGDSRWDLECTRCGWLGTDTYDEWDFGPENHGTVRAWAQEHAAACRRR